MRTLCYYVSAHGLGHAARSAQIIRALPSDVHVIVRSGVDPAVLGSMLGERTHTLAPAEFDCGCVQLSGACILARETLDRYAEIEQDNCRRIAAETAFLKERKVDAVASDIAPFPLHAAREAAIPAAAVSNFTWVDIYDPLAESAADRDMIRRMARQYGDATMAILLSPPMPNMHTLFGKPVQVGVVGEPGHSRRAELCSAITDRSGAARERLALLYFGIWGMPIDWRAVESIEGWSFVMFDRAAGAPESIAVLSRAEWRYEDIAASVDAVVGKTGYGLVSQCLASGAPLIYPPRDGFAEHAVLAAALQKRGLGVAIEREDFESGLWQAALECAAGLKRQGAALEASGAQEAAALLGDLR